MDLDTTFYKGSDNKPAAIFIHGLGMDKAIWASPSSSRILGGSFPLKTLLGKRPSVKYSGLYKDASKKASSRFSTGEQPDNIQTLFDDLRLKGHTVITWSQKRPAGPIDSVVPELEEIVRDANRMTNAGIILIGHSRGGLIARRHLSLTRDSSIRALVTISTPHKGSSIARIANYLSPIVPVIEPLFSTLYKGTLSFTIRRILEFLRSRALKELLPGSNFLKSLKDGPFDGVYYISVGGTNPTLLTFYRWRLDAVRGGKSHRRVLRPDELFSIPDIFEKLIPKDIYPEEIKKGKGDGLVSAESSRIPWCNEHYNFELNHAAILFDEGIRAMLAKAIDSIS